MSEKFARLRGSGRAKKGGNRIRDNQLDILRRFKEVTYAFANFVRFALRTVLEWVVSVADFPEEVDLILASKEGSSDAVDRCVAPSLSELSQCMQFSSPELVNTPHSRSHQFCRGTQSLRILR